MRLVVVAVLAACAPSRGPLERPRPATMRVEAVTEPAAVTALAQVGPFLFVAAGRGLQRWRIATGELEVLDRAGLTPTDHVLALAGDERRRALWFVTAAGVGRYDLDADVTVVVACPPDLALDVAHPIAIAVAGDGTAWLGHRGGVHEVATGELRATPMTEPVTALSADPTVTAALWVGTSSGLRRLERAAGDGLPVVAPADGPLAITSVRFLAQLAPSGGPASATPGRAAPAPALVVVGDDVGGRQRVAIGVGGRWSSYRLLPDARWDAVTASEGVLVARAGRRLFRVTLSRGARRRLSRQSARLVSLDGRPVGDADGIALDVAIELLPASVSAQAGVLVLGAAASTSAPLWLGTRSLGVARLAPDGGRIVGWLRRREMFTAAARLTVACVARDHCWIATGAGPAWRWRGAGLEPDVAIGDALAVARRDDGELALVHRSTDARRLVISVLADRSGVAPSWTTVAEIGVAPERRTPVEITFAAFAPDGRLWIGGAERDGAGRADAAGAIAIVDLARGTVTWSHRPQVARMASAARERSTSAPRVGPTEPVAIVDVAFAADGVAWFATEDGVVRVAGHAARRWSTRDGLPDAAPRSIVLGPGSGVYVATERGVAVWSGRGWTVPARLAAPARDLAVTARGTLWLATARGLAVDDGRRLRHLDLRRGLVENDIVDVAADHLGRIWGRSTGSLVLVTP